MTPPMSVVLLLSSSPLLLLPHCIDVAAVAAVVAAAASVQPIMAPVAVTHGNVAATVRRAALAVTAAFLPPHVDPVLVVVLPAIDANGCC